MALLREISAKQSISETKIRKRNITTKSDLKYGNEACVFNTRNTHKLKDA